MLTEYARITRSDNQTVDCVGLLTGRTYVEAEFTETFGVDCPPEVDEVVLIHEINNDEVVVVSRLKQHSSTVKPGEMRVHNGKGTGVYFKEDGSVELYKGSAEMIGQIPNQTIEYKVSQKISIENSGNIVLGQVDTSGTVLNGIVIKTNGDVQLIGNIT